MRWAAPTRSPSTIRAAPTLPNININLGVGGVGDGAADTIFIFDDADLTVVDNGNGDLTILGLSGATVQITDFEALNDHLVIDGIPFVF